MRASSECWTRAEEKRPPGGRGWGEARPDWSAAPARPRPLAARAAPAEGPTVRLQTASTRTTPVLCKKWLTPDGATVRMEFECVWWCGDGDWSADVAGRWWLRFKWRLLIAQPATSGYLHRIWMVRWCFWWCPCGWCTGLYSYVIMW